MKFSYYLVAGLLFFGLRAEEKFIVVITTSYNNAQWHDRNLTSIFSQTHKNIYLIYTDDASTDGTADLVQKWLDDHNVADRATVIRNKTRVGAMANQYRAIHLVPDKAIVCIVDGDDWLAGPNAFAHVNKMFSDENVWFTYGQFVTWPGHHHGWCVDIPKSYVNTNAFRDFPHNLSHMRAFYAGLFNQIPLQLLMLDGEFVKMAPDNAATFPMAEMARDGHLKFNPEVLYVWNGANNLNEHKVVRGLQRATDLRIRKMTRCEKIDTPFKDGLEATITQVKENIAKAIEEGSIIC